MSFEELLNNSDLIPVSITIFKDIQNDFLEQERVSSQLKTVFNRKKNFLGQVAQILKKNPVFDGKILVYLTEFDKSVLDKNDIQNKENFRLFVSSEKLILQKEFFIHKEVTVSILED